jgi:HEPN domain-containing protein
MSPDADSVAFGRLWLRRARSNLALARQPKPEEALWEDLCFDAQQAAEKAVKAVLVLHAVDFPRTHQIGELLAILRQAGHHVPEELGRADSLSEYAVTTRYPDAARPVDESEYRQSVELAERVVRWAEAIVRGA